MTLELLAPDDAIETSLDAGAPSAFAAVPPILRRALEARGFTALTAVQQAVVEAAGAGCDLQISSQTGSGKTVALGFVLTPGLEAAQPVQGPQALIIVPTRELATQVCAELSWLLADVPGAKVSSVTGGTPTYLDRQVLARGPRVLVGTPGRLLDHLRSGALDLGGVVELVLDEADQMLDMGFREELEGILDATPATRRTHLVSATFPAGIQRLAERYQRDPLAIEGTKLGEANGDIEHEGYFVRPDERYAALVNLLLLAGGERTLIFVPKRAEAAELSERLARDGFAALPLSGELVQSQRVRTLETFRTGAAKVLVATDVAARGLDVPDVNMVVHTAPPRDAHVYTHRSGRTGRAGRRGRSVLLASPSARRRVTRLLAEAGIELEWRVVPGAQAVRDQLSARARKVLREDLDAALAARPPAAHLAHARELLGERDAELLVAALLSRLEPAPRTEPREVAARRETAQPERRAAPHREASGHMAPSDSRGMVRFFVNWGVNQGASPGRVLAAICRRGAVTGADVGSIAVHPNASTFDVRAEVVERFERLAQRRDPRDPRTLIRRDRGPNAGRRDVRPARRNQRS